MISRRLPRWIGPDGLMPEAQTMRPSVSVRSAILAGKERGRRDLLALLGQALGAGLLRLHQVAVLPDPLWL